MQKKRCGWCEGDALYEAYHDKEWGVPVYDDKTIFEFLILKLQSSPEKVNSLKQSKILIKTGFAEQLCIISAKSVQLLLRKWLRLFS